MKNQSLCYHLSIHEYAKIKWRIKQKIMEKLEEMMCLRKKRPDRSHSTLQVNHILSQETLRLNLLAILFDFMHLRTLKRLVSLYMAVPMAVPIHGKRS
jgi:hypothetical protein